MNKSNKIHLCILLLGMVFTLIPIFHSNLWFDESYSVSLASHSFIEIWNIDIHDVHPVFYYDCLHILYLLFGNNIIIYRSFSWLCLSILGIFGYTHIRKEFGDKVGIIFSFFVFFFPLNIVYASEIRMYMLVMLFVCIGTFYAYKITKEENGYMNHVGMVLCFLIAAYTHYYGLLAAACVNITLFVYLLKSNRKELKKWIVDAFIQIGGYLPWIFILLSQTKSVKESFWIYWNWPWTYIDTFLFIFSGNLEKEEFIPRIIVILYAFVIILGTVLSLKKQKKNSNFLHFTIGIYIWVIIIACVASLVMGRAVFYARYLLVCHGLLLLFWAYVFSYSSSKKYLCLIITFTLGLSIVAIVHVSMINYDSSNQAAISYIEDNIQEDDVIFVSNYQDDPNSFILVSQLNEYPVIYYNECNWSNESILAYQAFGKDMTVVDSLENLPNIKGRIWVIYGDDDECGKTMHVLQEASEAFQKSINQSKYFQTRYKNIEYTIGLIS